MKKEKAYQWIGLNGVRLMPGTGCVSRVARISGGGLVVEIKGR